MVIFFFYLAEDKYPGGRTCLVLKIWSTLGWAKIALSILVQPVLHYPWGYAILVPLLLLWGRVVLLVSPPPPFDLQFNGCNHFASCSTQVKPKFD